LDLQPGRILVVRPDLHSAGCMPPAALGSLLGCLRSPIGAGVENGGPGVGAGGVVAGARA